MRLLRILLIAGVLLLCAATGPNEPSASPAPAAFPDRELVVATKVAPPFAIKGADGDWQGISIDLWRRMAGRLHLRYRFTEMKTVQDLLDATAEGKADVAVAAISVTAERAKISDFTQPFYETGAGVAVAGGPANWLPVLRTFLSFRFLQAVLALLGIALFVGILVWLFERRSNEHFGGKPAKGLISGIWWSAVAMTQAGAAQGGPATLPGRLLAVVWMIASIIALAVFTAGLTSAITTRSLQGLVRTVDDLRSLRVGVVGSSSEEEFLDSQRIAHRALPNPQAGLQALRAGRIDAFVYDRPLLTWIVRQNFSDLRVLGVTFDRQNYAIALPPNSGLRVPLDVTLLDTVQDEWWLRLLYRYLGAAGTETAAAE
jgi:polar amino acid transport system substrate-binding protein